MYPFFALNADGNPVYDLGEKEIRLYVNGKACDIISFSAFKFEDATTTAAIETSPKRLNIIIIDSVLDVYVDKNSKELATGIVQNGGPGDAFFLFECNQKKGLKYLCGPEKDKIKLIAAIDNIKRTKAGYTILINPLINPTNEGNSPVAAFNYAVALGNMTSQIGFKQEYEMILKRFADSLVWLKYALKTVSMPKNVFMISSGMPTGYMEAHSMTENFSDKPKLRNDKLKYYQEFLKRIALTVSLSGSMFYVIDPRTDTTAEQSSSLKYMANVSGGKFFHGQNPDQAIKNIQKATSAYYEIAFYPPAGKSGIFDIQLKTSRKNTRIYSVKYSEKPTPYKDMTREQRRLFVINTIIDGNWSRMVSEVRKVTPIILNAPPQKIFATTEMKYVQLPIPAEMKSKEFEIYLVNIDKINEVGAIGLKKTIVSDTVTIAFPSDRTKSQYIVLVEPNQPFCIYTEII